MIVRLIVVYQWDQRGPLITWSNARNLGFKCLRYLRLSPLLNIHFSNVFGTLAREKGGVANLDSSCGQSHLSFRNPVIKMKRLPQKLACNMTYSNKLCCISVILNVCDSHQFILKERAVQWLKFSHCFSNNVLLCGFHVKIAKSDLKSQRNSKHIQAPELILHLKLLYALLWINWPLRLIVIKLGLSDLLEI